MIKKFFQLNVKKGALESLEARFLKISYFVWRKTESSLLLCFIKLLEQSRPYVNLKRVKLRGTSIKIPFFVLEKKRVALVLGWIRSNTDKKTFFSSLEAFFLKNSLLIEDFKKIKISFHEIANKHKVFAYKRWF